MNSMLIQDACHLLQGEISPETGIHLNLIFEDVLPITTLINQYELPKTRSTYLLSIYIAIKLAFQSHDQCDELLSGEALTRKILDGDYLYSLYVQMCLKWREYDLLIHLAPVIKQIQIQRINGDLADDTLLKSFGAFLKIDQNLVTTSKAI